VNAADQDQLFNQAIYAAEGAVDLATDHRTFTISNPASGT
jgi:hypothetical protein